MISNMERVLAGVLALLIAAAGWHYLFYSTVATRLGGIEDQAINRRRVVLRRVGGGLMFILAVLLTAGFHSAAVERSGELFLAVWLGVASILGTLMILAMVDVRLTLKLRRRATGRRGDDERQ